MRLINKLNANSFQNITLTGNAGQRIIMELRYMPTQELWVADFQLDDFIIRGINIVCSPNLLRCFNIPFGLAVVTDDGQDPRSLNDFDTEYAKLYLLTEDESDLIDEAYYE